MGERVVIADDNPVVRTVIGAALEEAGFERCGEAEAADEAIELAAREQPDLCLLDIYMPGSGIRAAKEIASRSPQTTVVMLTSSARDQDLLDALRAGARGYIPKQANSERVVATLRTVLRGEVAMPRHLVAKAIRPDTEERVVRLLDGGEAKLSGQQLELIDMLADERTAPEIAQRWLVSTADAQEKIDELLAVLHVPDTRTAVRLVTPQGR